ncbi:MAG: type II toxin-antitoxin system HicB family antitoxin [Candidatus Sericytochromatia bacterium]|nr:type II toxin-antitoxin system HicB family antitoxin [Candidatus Sericytochromatia bacterium]
MATYIALLRKIPESDYGVDFPDFPGCITAGLTLDEAYRMAEAALIGHTEVMAEHGDPIPQPSSLDTVMADPDNRDAIPFLVRVSQPKGRVIRLNISLDEHLIAEIDAKAAMLGKTRSGFLADAARAAIQL